MKCDKIQHLISDSADGAVSKEENAVIQAHIETCSVCRTYLDQVEAINELARSFDAPEVSPERSGEFAMKLRSAISELEGKSNGGVLRVFRKKWIFVPASVFVLSLFILIFVFYEKGDFLDEEVYVLSFGNAVEEIYQDMGSDLELQEAFHSLVSASIDEMLIATDWDERLEWEDNYLLWEEFSEEERGVLDPEIKKDNNS